MADVYETIEMKEKPNVIEDWIKINRITGLEQVLELISPVQSPKEESEPIEKTIIHQRKRQRMETKNDQSVFINSNQYNKLLQKIVINKATLSELYTTLDYIPQNDEFKDLHEFIYQKIEQKNNITPERIIFILAMLVFCLNFYSYFI